MLIDKEKLDSLPFYVTLVDSRHHIHYANKAMRNALGMSLEQLVGQYCPRVVHDLEGPYPGCPLEAAVKGIEFEREYYDEGYGCWFLLTAYPTGNFAEDGDEIFFHSVQDITGKKKAELAQDREQESADPVKDAENIFFITTVEGVLVELNDTGMEMFGLTHEDTQSEIVAWQRLGIEPDDWNRMLNALTNDGFVYDFELSFGGVNGRSRVLLNATIDDSRRAHKSALIRATGRIQT